MGPGPCPIGRRILCALPRRFGRERSIITEAVVVVVVSIITGGRRRPSAGAHVAENRRGRLAGVMLANDYFRSWRAMLGVDYSC